ncbi:trypsin-like peptidase domain-containing protein [Altererythrobacter sp.]|uniref:trypsin-like peptidase domain-containing protein n=1 Tax=Altererythrobacter sp. TaxID=1872480 RepID=UPI003D09002F
MAYATIDNLLDRLVETEDIDGLHKLAEILAEHSDKVQGDGEMAEHLELRDIDAFCRETGIEPDPAKEGVELLNLANRIANAIRLAEFRRDRRNRPELPTVVAEGDSWFLHQMITDTLDHLRKNRFNVRSMAAAGDTVANMLAGDGYVDILRDLGARVFLFCGGGNDFLGNGRIAKVLRKNDDSLPVEDLVNEPVFGKMLADVFAEYQKMLSILAKRLPEVLVFAPGYDYLAKIDKGPWLWPYLKKAGYSQERACDAIAVLLDRFNAGLADLDAENQNFTHVSVLDVVNRDGRNRGSWYDAIHPKAAGFGRVSDKLAGAIDQFLSTPVTEGASEAVFGAGLSPARPIRRIRLQLEKPREMREAIAQAYANPLESDFEAVKASVRNLPPESEWLCFRDPHVHKHIKDVLCLLGDPHRRGQTEEHVTNRMRTRPSAMTREGEFRLTDAMGTLALPEQELIEINLLEALFGRSEIEPVQMLLNGYKASRAIGRIQVVNQHGTHVGHGTGFMVAPGLLLTNQHVLEDAATARRSFLILDDEDNLDGTLIQKVRFRITDDVYWSSVDADYAFCSVELVNANGVNLENYGHLKLISESGKALNFEPVSIVQHPGGNPKAIAVRNSFIMGRVDSGVYYTTDTLPGSSGAAVFNTEWQVVALHHRYVPHPTIRDGVLANRGVRISHIYSDLLKERGRGNSQAEAILQRLLTDQPGSQGPAEIDHQPDLDNQVETGTYAGLSTAEFRVATTTGVEDFEPDLPLPEALILDTAETLLADETAILGRLGPEGYRFIVAHEVSSKATYEQKLTHPILPGAASGVTIGIGYDLGYKTREEFRANWGDLLSEADLRALEACLGRTKANAAAVLPGVRHVTVPFEAAVKVFERHSLPKVYGQLQRHFGKPALEVLSGECLAALMSLTFNRGPSFQAHGKRYREMRLIRTAIRSGRLSEIPSLIRSMKRLWQGLPNVRGLLRRREEEADLFEAGLVSLSRSDLPAAAETNPNSPPFDEVDVDLDQVRTFLDSSSIPPTLSGSNA